MSQLANNEANKANSNGGDFMNGNGEQSVNANTALQANMIPDKNSCGTALPTIGVNNGDIMAFLIDEDERAIADERAVKINGIIRKLAQLPMLGRVQEIFKGRLLGRIYEDQNGFRYIEFAQKYIDGSYSPKMSIAQEGLMLFAKAKVNNNPSEKMDMGIKKRITKFKSEVRKEYLGKFRGDIAEALELDDILKELMCSLAILPVYSEDDKTIICLEFYNEMVEVAKDFVYRAFDNHKCYYAFTEEEIVWLAERMKLSKIKLLRKLKNFNLLYLTDSSNGYQVNVRCQYPDGTETTEWRYCIAKLDYIAGVEEKKEENVVDYDAF